MIITRATMSVILGLLGYTLALLVLSLITFTLIYFGYIHYQHKKYEHIPGPKRTSFVWGNYQQFRNYMKETNLPFAELIYQWYTEYGLVYRVQFMHNTLIILLDSTAVKEVLTNSKHLKPQKDYDPFIRVFGERFAGNGLVNERNHQKWAKRRALFNPAFHRKYLVGLINEFNESADRLMDHLRKKADGQTEVAMLDEFNNITLDVIGKVGFGLDLNIIEDPNCPFPMAASMALRGLQTTLMVPWSGYLPTSEARQFRREVRKACRLLRQVGLDCIMERLEAKARGDELPPDVLTYILGASDGLRGDQEFGIEEMIDEFITFFIAGQETTGNLLSFTLQQLSRFPEVLKKVLEELESVLGDKHFVDYQDLSKLEYMMLVLKETMRQYPPVPGTTRVLGTDLQSCGFKIPKGTRVRVNHYAMGMMDRYFDNPKEFRPERFKVTDEKPRHMYAYFPFSLGQRSCIGQQMALMESRVILAKLLRQFQFDLVPGQRFIPKAELTMKPIDRVKSYITLRE